MYGFKIVLTCLTVRSLIQKKYSLSPKVMCQLFDALLVLFLIIHARFGDPENQKNIRASSPKVLQAPLKVESSTSSCGVYGELDRYPLFITRYARIVKYWSRI